ncbi:MAG TPA: UDP-3-O-(3-hydroxymyristoyl)glucosamine N-acyltransferase [Candidatus Hydrogenedentes bacterium]|nr:UDP-3-O-(3-hydroxymyristoyl)glucosamine N-acyltransferase [Candidatus Hydrogenedentota bacterium]
MGHTVEDIARLVGGEALGDPDTAVTGVNGLAEAGPGDLCFVRGEKYYPLLRECRAAAVLVPEPVAGAAPVQIRVDRPEEAFLRTLALFDHGAAARPAPGVHPGAHVSPEARLGAGVSIGPGAVVEAGAVLGDGVVLFPGAYIGADCRVGEGTVVHPNAVLREETIVGRGCIIHAGACLGSDGFGFVPMGGAWHKVPQVGRVELGDEVEIGSNTTVDRATFGVTRIGGGTKIDNLVQIGHNVEIGEHCVVAGMAGIAGSAKIGNHVRIGASAGIAGHITIGDGASVGGRSGVTRSVPPGATVSGFPATDHEAQKRIMVGQMRLPGLMRRINQLEARLKALEESES